MMEAGMIHGTSESPFRALSAWAPLLLACAALAVLGGYLLTGPHDPTMVIEYGVARPDEGPAARLWQLIMGVQLPARAGFRGGGPAGLDP
jgi:hypothetical protein